MCQDILRRFIMTNLSHASNGMHFWHILIITHFTLHLELKRIDCFFWRISSNENEWNSTKNIFSKKIKRNARCLQATFLRNETEQNAWSLMNGKSRSLKIASGHSQMRFLYNKCAHAKQIIKIFEWNARFQVIAKWEIIHVGLNKEHVANNLTRWAKTEYNFVVQKSRTYN